jgi:hypothetical protein
MPVSLIALLLFLYITIIGSVRGEVESSTYQKETFVFTILFLGRFLTKRNYMPAILPQDMSELKRIATNTYEEEKRDQILRIIRGINELESQIRKLQIENESLKKKD